MNIGARARIYLSALAVAVLEVVGTFGASNNQPDRRQVDALCLALVLIGPAALAVRDRAPRFAAAAAIASISVYLAFGYAYGPVFLSGIVAVVALVLRGDRRYAWAFAGLWFAGFGVAEAVDPKADHPWWIGMSFVGGWMAVMITASELLRQHREQVAAREVAAREEQKRISNEQRLTLAQDLHDVLAHNISLVNVQASVALHLLDEQPERARPALAAIKSASHDALQELRVALDALRSDARAPRLPSPRLSDLDALVDGVRASGLAVDLECVNLPASLAESVELAAYRIVQEALTNVTRHAQASRAVVHLEYDEDLVVDVSDDGIGGDPRSGRGLIGMQERAAALGGTLEAGPVPEGRGFRVRAVLPVSA